MSLSSDFDVDDETTSLVILSLLIQKPVQVIPSTSIDFQDKEILKVLELGTLFTKMNEPLQMTSFRNA